jgi:CRP/FNR family cyclic AMP-dependent transcriptional regulator
MAEKPVTDDRQRIIERLANSALLAYFTTDELQNVVSMVRTRRFGKGDLIFLEGDVGEELYLVEEGKVAISKAVKGNLEQVLAHMGPGEYFGEMALLDKIPRTASASAEEDCVLMAIGKDDLFTLMEKEPKAAAKLMFNLLKTFTTRLKATNEQLKEAVRWGLEATGYQPEV